MSDDDISGALAFAGEYFFEVAPKRKRWLDPRMLAAETLICAKLFGLSAMYAVIAVEDADQPGDLGRSLQKAIARYPGGLGARSEAA